MPDRPSFKLMPTSSASVYRVFKGRWPIGTVTKEVQGWRPDGGQPTDVRPSKEAAAARLVEMEEQRYADRCAAR